eukprot:jgi/Astpho2/397/Aster-x0923
MLFALGILESTHAASKRPTQNVEAADDIPLIKQLVERTAANKDRRAKERLDDYNRRNFTDYFTQGSSSGISKETKAKIDAWLQNKQ